MIKSPSTASQIILNKFKPRWYQRGLFDAIENRGIKKALCIFPRRCLSGLSNISMADGTTKLLKDMKKGDEIISWNGLKFVDDVVVNVWEAGIKPTVIVKGKGSTVVTSPDHRFACFSEGHASRDKQTRFRKAKDLRPSTYVLMTADNKHGYIYRHVLVKPGMTEQLYDMETTHGNFVANGFVVHNSGKDIAAWNLCIRQALRRVGVYFYILVTYSQARKVIWDSITSSGMRFLDYIPPELIARKNEQEMKITLTNGSIIQLCGSNDYDKLMGTNPCGIVFSEYALQDPRARQFLSPILLANNGWAVYISTVRGKNHLYELYNIAKDNPEWYCSKLSVEDTKHVDVQDIEDEIATGEISRQLAMQEYYNDFSIGIEGAYYCQYIDKMRLNNQIGPVPWEPSFKCSVALDLGMRDSTTLIFFQVIGQTVRIIDTYSNSGKGLEHYVSVINAKPYEMAHFIAPHDISVRELGTGLSRIEKARQLGINFEIAPNISIIDGIEAVRTTLPKCWIDETKCKDLIEALENYRKEYNAKTKTYGDKPLHNHHSHFADAFRYLSLSLPKMRDGMTPEDARRIREESMYGTGSAKRGNPFYDQRRRF